MNDSVVITVIICVSIIILNILKEIGGKHDKRD